MKYFVSALIAATAFAQFDPTNCCGELPANPRCLGCNYVSGSLGMMSAPDVTELIDGVLVGALLVEHVDGLETCIKDIDPLVTHITTAVDDFEEGSPDKMTSAVLELGNFYAQVATTMEGCNKISSDGVT